MSDETVHAAPAPLAPVEKASAPPPKSEAKPEPESVPVRKSVIPMRARFVVQEITHTTRGATVLLLTAAYDGDIEPKSRLAPGNSPKGELTVEVVDAYAAANVSHGSVFYLVSA
jgi:hypothetical protein